MCVASGINRQIQNQGQSEENCVNASLLKSCDSVSWQLPWHGTKVNIVILLDTIDVISFKLCMMVVLIQLWRQLNHVIFDSYRFTGL